MNSLLTAAEQLNSFLVLGGISAWIVVITKFFERDDYVQILRVKIPLSHVWIPFLVLTAAHLYFSYFFILRSAQLLECEDVKAISITWARLTESDAKSLFVFYGMRERSPIPIFGALPLISHPESILKGDVLMAVHILFVFGVFFSTARFFGKVRVMTKVLTSLVGLSLLIINLVAGSQWALVASDLARHARDEPKKMEPILEMVRSFSASTCKPLERLIP